jgi:hypothetical protein
MPIVHECAEPDCPILTMGEYCIEHEAEHAEPESLTEALVDALP